MNSNFQFEENDHDLFLSKSNQNKWEIFSLSKRILRAKNLIDKFEKELTLHPVLYNNLIEKILVENGKEKNLIYLDPEVYSRNFKSNEEDEDDNKIINKLFEPNVIKSSKKEFLSKTSLFSLKEKQIESTFNIEQNNPKTDENLQVYTREHFKWLFKQNKKHNLYKKLEACFSKTCKEINGKKDLNLEQKIKEFCSWAELNYDCKELELDAITLMKIFLVNYDKGPLMWTPINLEEISRKDFKINMETNLNSDSDSDSENSSLIKKSLNEKKYNLKNDSDEKKNLKTNLERRNNYGRWYLPSNYWSKRLLRFMGAKLEKNDIMKDKTSNKLLKSTGVKLFSEFFRKNRNGRFPYFIEQRNIFVPIS